MYKLAIFAGTTEGRRLAELCAENRIEAYMEGKASGKYRKQDAGCN